MLVRTPTPHDREGLVALLALRHEEFGFGRFDAQKADRTVQAAIDRSAAIIAGVIGLEGAPEATIGLGLAQWWDTSDYHLEALWDYVHPDCRTADHSRKLDQFAEMAADRFGLQLIMGGPVRAGHEGKVRAYCKRFRPVGVFFDYSGPETPRPPKKQREASAASLIQAFVGALPK